jgi:hypothetical protein
MDCTFAGASGAGAAALFFFADEREGVVPEVAIVTETLTFSGEKPADESA